MKIGLSLVIYNAETKTNLKNVLACTRVFMKFFNSVPKLTQTADMNQE